MPIYEFICQKCCHQFESLVRLGGEKGVTCPQCRSGEVKKLCSSFGIGGGASRLKSASASCTSCATKTCSTCH